MSFSTIRHIEPPAWALAIGIFSLFWWLTPTWSVDVLYVAPILLTLWTRNPWMGVRVAALATALIAVQALLQPEQPLTNHLAALAVVWLAAGVIARYRVNDLQRRRSVRDLEGIRNALDQSAIVATTNVAGDITYANDKFCEISGYDREYLVGQNHRVLNSGLHTREFFKDMYATISKGRVWHGEIRNRAKAGHFYWVDTTIVPLLDERHEPYQFIAIRYDITEQKQATQELREQSALAQLGRMAAVVAHEVRNPLAGIRGAIQMIGQRLPDDSSEKRVVGEIVDRVDGLDDIVSDLLQFSRPREPVFQTMSLSLVIRDTVALISDDARFANVEVQIEDSDAQVSGDAEQLKLVLLNLVLNAAQAMNGAGTITIRSTPTTGWHELRVIDQGPGVPAEIRQQLFEPFFTTKSRGTGLGLATAQRVVVAHGGSVALECPPEGGTVAVVRLPRR